MKILFNMKKCEFGKQYLVFLGNIIDYEKPKIDPKKVIAIEN